MSMGNSWVRWVKRDDDRLLSEKADSSMNRLAGVLACEISIHFRKFVADPGVMNRG